MRKSQAIELFRKLRRDTKESLSQPETATDPDSSERQQILFKTYLIEKRGRTFGSSQYRKFFIEDGRLYQQSDKQKKVLPLPSTLTIEIKFKGRKWNDLCQDLPIRLYLQFPNRTPIFIYFSNIRESQEIRTYILALKMKEAGKSLSINAFNYREAALEAFKDRLMLKGGSFESNSIRDKKRLAIQNILSSTTRADQVHSLVEMWQQKADRLEKSHSRVIFSFRFKSFRSLHVKDLKLIAPVLRVVLAGRVVYEFRPLPTKQNDTLVYYNHDINFIQPAECGLKEELVLEISDGRAKWKSERMQLMDLWRHNQRIICIPLQSSQPYPAILLQYFFSPENTVKPFWYRPIVYSPENYYVLNEIIGGQDNENPTILHQNYTIAVEQYLRSRSEQTIFYWLKKFIESLQIQQLINKGFESQPFKSLPLIKQHRGTIIYRHFIILSRDFRYYDVERIIWRYGQPHLRRIFNAIKCFDAEPARINFTEKIYFLILKVFEIVDSTSDLFWNDTLFENSCIGKESAAFFVSLVLLRKIAPNYWSVGARERGISNNSLLFHYIWRNTWKNGESYKNLYRKFNRLEINIEALFGVHSVSLLSELFEGHTYFRMLTALISQVNIMKSIYNFALIGLFLSLLDRVSKCESAFESPSNFLLALELTAKNIHNSYEFLRDGDLYIDQLKKEVCMPRFLEIKQSMDSFYQENQMKEKPSDIIPAIYSAFSNYQYKNETVERFLHICIDKIELNAECPKLSLFILQNNVIISESQFSSAPLRQLNYALNLKLQSLADLVIGVLEDPTAQALFCRLNPRNIPSNYNFQLTLPLEKQQPNLYLDQPCPFISLQLFIKQPQAQRALPKLQYPQKYVDYFLDTQDIKPDITTLQKYMDMASMTENNFNLMYGKLGWWGNYFTIPEQRLLQIYEVGNQSIKVPDDRDNFYKLAKYSRQVYGRAMICSHAKKYFVKYTKNNIECCSIHRPADTDNLRTSFIANSILCTYALETVVADNTCYMDFFLRAMELPLISYLTYDPEKIVAMRELSFELRVASQKSLVIFTPTLGDEFVIFSEAEATEIENNVSFRVVKLRPKHLFKYPNMTGPVDNFLYYLRLNILQQIISIEPADPKILSKWPNRLTFSSSEVTQPLQNIPLYKLFLLVTQTDYHLSLQFSQSGKPKLKYFKSWAFLKHYHKWKPVEVLCSISSIFKHYFVEEQLNRRRFIVKEAHVVVMEEVRAKISCENEEIKDGRSVLYKKLDKMF